MSSPVDPPDPSDSQSALPTADRRRVIAEEEFRKATAKRLDREMESSRHRWGRMLNTPVVIWLLSTVVVGVASWAYQQRTRAQQHEAEQRQLTVRTTDELLYRLSACDRIDSSSNRDDVENLLSSVIGLRPLYKEFENRNLGDIYYQFCSLSDPCRLAPDSFLAITADIRRTTWPEIVGQPIRHPLRDRKMLPKLRLWCSRLEPVRPTARAALQLSRQ